MFYSVFSQKKFDFFAQKICTNKKKSYLCIAIETKTVSCRTKGLVVQLVRIHACHAWGRGFESRPDRNIKTQSLENKVVAFFFYPFCPTFALQLQFYELLNIKKPLNFSKAWFIAEDCFYYSIATAFCKASFTKAFKETPIS